MNMYFLRIFALLAILSVTTAHAVTYPTGYPSGEQPGGWFNTYFANMFTAPCAPGQVVQGFTSTGVILCVSPVASVVSCIPGGNGSHNVCYGSGSLGENDLGDHNTANGFQSLYSNLGGSWNTAHGDSALFSNTSGNSNTAIGNASLYSNTSGNSNSALGLSSLQYNTVGSQNTANGAYALGTNTAGSSNAAYGYGAGGNLIAGDNNTAVGANTNFSNAVGSNQLNIANLIFGIGLNGSVSAPAGNIGIGTANPGAKLDVAGQIKITGGNPGIGKVLTSDATGLAIWSPAGSGLPCIPGGSGLYNTCYGSGSLQANTVGHHNTANGVNSLFANTTGHNNTALGYGAGSDILNGDNNIFIGYNTLSNIGTNASNQLNIGNWIYGNNGNIGIGVPSPGAKLDVGGALKLSSGNATDIIYSNNSGGLILESQGNTHGRVRLTMQNITGSNGAIFEMPDPSSPQVVDFGFRTVSGGQRNLRFETRLSKLFGVGNVPEFQLGTADDPTMVVSDNGSFFRRGSVGIGTTNPSASLEVVGNVKITGGNPGAGKVLTSDATGFATWLTPILGATSNATGVISTSGSMNYITKFGSGGIGIYPSQIFESGSHIGINTINPRNTFEIDSGVPDTSGLRFSRLTSVSPITSNGIVSIGVDGSGDVVAVSPVSNIAVYEGVNPAGTLNPDPDLSNLQIKYNFNNYFAIPGRQSFVVSKGDSAGYNAPYFRENGVSGICSGSGSPYDCSVNDPSTGLSASPYNSFTISAKGDLYGYQIALGARGDAPLFARSGRFNTALVSTGGLYLADQVTPSPWQKILSVPVNHPEYFSINTGYDSQLNTQSGGGNVGIGTTWSQSRFEIWTGASTAPLMHFRGNNNVALGLDALDVTATGILTSSNNTAIGFQAGMNITSGSNNIMIGADARAQTGTSSNALNIGNTIFGSGIPATFGGISGNIGLGIQNPLQQLDISRSMNLAATTGSTTGVIYKGNVRFIHNYVKSQFPSSNLFVGLNAGNFAMGTGSIGDPIYFGTENIGIGNNALTNNTQGYSNTALGVNAMNSNTTGSNNTALGYATLTANTSGGNNTAIGRYALTSNTTGGNNMAIGLGALQSNTSGGSNAAIGFGALQLNTTGCYNTSIGLTALQSNTIGCYNAAIGAQSLNKNDSGYYNTANGFQALYNAVGDNNTALGAYAGQLITTGRNNIAIGYGAAVLSPTLNNQLSIGNWIYGSNGNIGIGTSSPGAKLEVAGQVKITGGSPGAGKILMSDAVGLATWQTPSSASNIPWAIIGNSGTIAGTHFVGTTDLVDLVFKTNNSEQMRITSTGGVGIGTSNPGNYLLNVNGPSYFANNIDVGSGRFMNFMNPGVGGTAGFQWALQNDQASLYVTEKTANNTDYVFKLSDDAVGDRFMWWIHDSGGLDIYPMILSGDYGNFYSGGIYINNSTFGSPRVGFGTTSPDSSTRVDINGLLRIRGGNPAIGRVLVSDANGIASWQDLSSASGSFANWSLLGNSGTTAITNFLGTIDPVDLVFKTNSIERMRLFASNGNLSLGGMILGRGPGSILGNTVLGNTSLNSNISGSNNTAIGYNTLANNTTGSNNTILGYNAGSGLVSGSNNIAIGYHAMVPFSGSSNQLSIGNWIYGNNGDIGIGTSSPGAKLEVAGQVKITGGNPGTGKILTSDATGLALWVPIPSTFTEWSKNGNSGTSIATDFIGTTDNMAFAIRTNNVERLRFDTVGNLSIAGMMLGRGPGSIVSNTALGVAALNSNITGASNTVLGNSALASTTVGSFNTAIGHGAIFNSTGNNNTAIGYNAGNNLTSGTNNIAIGYNSTLPTSTASNQLSIGNWIFGIGGNIGIGTSSPGQKLTVSGSLQMIDGNQGTGKYLVSDANGVASWQSPTWIGTGNYIYRMVNPITNSTTTLSSVTDLTSVALPVGPYQFELIGKFQSSSTSNGLRITLDNITASTTDFIGSASTQLTSSTMYVGSFMSPGVPVVSTDVPSANTDYPVFMKGSFNVTATGTVTIEYGSELGGSSVSLRPGTVLIIRSLNPTIFSTGI